MGLNETPRANRLHIGIYGKVNSGKSSLINTITNQEIAVVSNVEGTTTDPIYKAMEIHGIGPVVLIDTAGFSDYGILGEKRMEKTKEATYKSDIAIVLVVDDEINDALEWIEHFKKMNTPVIVAINKIDVLENVEEIAKKIEAGSGLKPIYISTKDKQGIEQIKEAIIAQLPQDYEVESITGSLCKDGDLVLLVMPQDIQAPKGRLILPQMQTLRDLLDKKCLVFSCTTDRLKQSLQAMNKAPDLIICDSQVFKTVYENKPDTSKLTSFSVLFAHYKGDVQSFIDGAHAIEHLSEKSHVLIAEACTHAPLSEDIGREKIPALLRKRVGNHLQIDVVSGPNFPEDLTKYDLIIHCGACMFNRKYVLNRIEKAKKANVAITNYGICIAFLNGILDKIDLQK